MLKKLTLGLLLLGVVSVLATAQNDQFWLNMADGIVTTLEGFPSNLGREEDDNVIITLPIINDTGYTVKSIFICKDGESDWGENLLPAILPKGRPIIVTLEVAAGKQLYNIRMIDIEGDKYTRKNIDIKRRNRVTIREEDVEF